jgi:poly(A) polymerase
VSSHRAGFAITSPRIIPRSEHDVSRSQISDNALKVLYRLKKSDYEAYLVGGGVRDILLGILPKDFDVATDARPEEIRRLFRNCRLIGRRFRLAHVLFGPEVIEVATFRGRSDPDDDGDHDVDDSGMVLRDNVYGSMEDDAFRRDFTINALYYNIQDFSIVDYVGGVRDLREGVIRIIGDAESRYREDPVRMLRAVRFAMKLGFRLHADTEAPIRALAERLTDIPPARLFDEYLKLFLSGKAAATFEALRERHLLGPLFPATERLFSGEGGEQDLRFIRAALESTDRRVAEGKPVTPAFLLAAFLWGVARRRAVALEAEGVAEPEALQAATAEVLAAQQSHVSIPRRFGLVIRDIMHLQRRLVRPRGVRAMRLLGHPRFRAAYDFLVLRAEAGEVSGDLADFWTRVQEMDAGERKQAFQSAGGERRGPGRRRRRPAPERQR